MTNIMLRNLNESYDIENKNLKFKEIKKIFGMNLENSKFINTNPLKNSFSKWIEKLEKKLSIHFARLKNEKCSKPSEEVDELTNKLTSLVFELENYISSNHKDIIKLIENSQFKTDQEKIEEIDSIKKLNEIFSFNSYSTDNENSCVEIDEMYEKILILKDITLSSTFHQFYSNKIQKQYQEMVEILKQNFEIYNYK
jgi:hypothetical protein